MDIDSKPDMAQWVRVREALDLAIERTPEERESILAGLRLDAATLRETRDLLAAADNAEHFMPLLSPQAAPTVPVYRSLPVSTRIGPFVVDALLGRGGHGEVYSATRQDGQFEQRVALKLLRPEALEQFDNFRAERQILAGLEHPGIARLIDGGVAPDGRPYMAMEFVEGAAIDTFCRENRLDLATRIRLTLDVCAAVAHAHTNLVVHGDIKPDNILVSADGVAKLLDFGVARLVDTSHITSGLTAALSTPAYAAPEQLAGRRATTATDIYALGALLYELLSGRPAWQIGDTALSWASRVLNDEPPLPSSLARVSDLTPDPALLRGDLDAIIGKAMRADPAARYETVPALADDLRRYLARLPVLARNGTVAYRLSRFVRRHFAAVAASAILVIGGATGTAAVAWNMQQAEAGRIAARLEAVRGESLRDFMGLMFRATDTLREKGPDSPRDILDAGAEQMEQDAEAGPLNPQLVRAMGEFYFEMEEFDAAHPFLQHFLDLANQQGDEALISQVKRLLASIALRQGDLAEAERLIGEAADIMARAPGFFARERAELDGLRAALLREQGQPEAGIALLRSAVAELTVLLGPNSLDTLILRQNLAVQLLDHGEQQAASDMLEDILAVLAATGRRQSAIAVAAISAQSVIASQQGDNERAADLAGEALTLRRQIYAPSSSQLPIELNFARSLSNLGRNREALDIYDESLRLSEDMGTQNSSMHAALLTNRGLEYISLGNLPAAGADIDEAMALISANFGKTSRYYAAGLFARAQLNYANGNMDAARTDLEQARPLFEDMGPGGQPYMAMIEQVQAILDRATP